MTHKKRDCLERPRKIGAKYTNANFAPDEFVQPNLSLTFDGKRDRSVFWFSENFFQCLILAYFFYESLYILMLLKLFEWYCDNSNSCEKCDAGEGNSQKKLSGATLLFH